MSVLSQGVDAGSGLQDSGRRCRGLDAGGAATGYEGRG